MEHIKTDKIQSLAWKNAYMFVNWFAELVHAYWRVSFVFVVFVVAFVLLFLLFEHVHLYLLHVVSCIVIYSVSLGI